MTYKALLFWVLPTSVNLALAQSAFCADSCTCQICAWLRTLAWAVSSSESASATSSIASLPCFIQIAAQYSFFMSLMMLSLLAAGTQHPLTLLIFLSISLICTWYYFVFQKLCLLTVIGWIMPSSHPPLQDVHILISRAITLHHKRDFANTIQSRVLRCKDYPRLSR